MKCRMQNAECKMQNAEWSAREGQSDLHWLSKPEIHNAKYEKI